MTQKQFGGYIARLLRKENLTREETTDCFIDIIKNAQSELQQGAFLAALSAKGETPEEIAAAWRVIYELDTVKVHIDTPQPIVENCGTGMDAVKTFNISSAASIVAASDGVPMARHGSRALTSACGTVDILQALGINVEASPRAVKKSVERAGIGVFNGMSPLVHPKALGRILAGIAFGSTLNIAASLANPARPRLAVRGVYTPDLLYGTAAVMREIGYTRALVVFGEAEPGMIGGIDEASTMGKSHICELSPDGDIRSYSISPEQFGITPSAARELAGGDIATEVFRLRELLGGGGTPARRDIVSLNAALILYTAGKQASLEGGYRRARELLAQGKPLQKLNEWIEACGAEIEEEEYSA